ncbi:MAG: XisI protein [Desulfobacteraceae bacterium]|nr:XisI protein [Desulfobacteraceae bacterium]
MEENMILYQKCIKRLLSAYQPLKTEWSEVELLFDDERKHYMAFRVGWFRQKRVHFCLVHIDICDDTVVIQANNTEDMIDDELIRMGIPREKICLGLLPPEVREYAA